MEEKKTAEEKKTISFHFHPYNFEKSQHAVEKADKTGKQRKFLCGISSGSHIDRHDERMTEKCIKSFNEQSNSGDILLYPDVHGIRASEDIGNLAKSDIMENGDWYTEYGLYDEADDVDQRSVEIAKKVWKQVRGEAPYKKPIQKGFSIEGYIPPGGILSGVRKNDGTISNRVIDNVLLDGVVLVPRPAYQDSIANAIYKALGEMMPEKLEQVTKTIQSVFFSALNDRDIENQFFKTKYLLTDALDEAVEKVMKRANDPNRQDQLALAFQEYSNLMIEQIMKSQDLFKPDGIKKDENPYGAEVTPAASHDEVFKAVYRFVKNKSKEQALISPATGVIKAFVSEIQKNQGPRRSTK